LFKICAVVSVKWLHLNTQCTNQRPAQGHGRQVPHRVNGASQRWVPITEDGREFDSQPLSSTEMGDFGWASHLSISPSHPGQLILLPSVGWEIPVKVQ